MSNKRSHSFFSIFLCLWLTAALSGCEIVGGSGVSEGSVTSGAVISEGEEQMGTLRVVTTLFPYYDFVRQLAGDLVTLSLVVPAGMDTHSFEPTPKDLIAMGKADLLIYNGGENEQWVSRVLESFPNSGLIADEMMQHVDTVLEEHVEGMEEEREEEVGVDEHIWTSPVNAIKIMEQIAGDLMQEDPSHKAVYRSNAEKYRKKLERLDKQFRSIVRKSQNNYLAFGDRFPLRYFVEEYGLEYTAAFAGCSSDTEPSADTIASLTDQVKHHRLSVVLKIELTSDKVANAIAEAASTSDHTVTVETFYTCHNVTKQQFDGGETYLSLMEHNLTVLKNALG